jgi:putative transposase
MSARRSDKPIERPDVSEECRHGLCLNKDYDYPEVYELVAELGFTGHVRSPAAKRRTRSSVTLVFAPAAGWSSAPIPGSNRFRGLLVRWSKKPRNHRALLQLACGLIAWRLATAEDLPG